MQDKEKKESFDKLWKQKYKDSLHEFESALWFYSNRRVLEGDIITCALKDTMADKKHLEVVQKPYYIDSYNKARYRGWLRCREVGGDGTIIVANIEHIITITRLWKKVQ